MALINYITNAGGGFERDQGPQLCYSYEELIKQVFIYLFKFELNTFRF